MKRIRLLQSFLLLAATIVLSAGCSKKTEDVRIKLCREVTERLLDSMMPITWKSQDTELRKVGDAAIRLGFFVDREGYENRLVTSTCFFEHNLPEESAVDHVDPLFAYSTLPYMMTVKGETVPDEILRKAVSDEQLEPFVEFLDKVNSKISELKNQ